MRASSPSTNLSGGRIDALHPGNKNKVAGTRTMLRLLVLKHIRNWSYEVLEREVRANLVYRDFTHVGGAKTPDARDHGSLGRGARAGGAQASS